VKKGEIVGILGPNGAGKTTTIKSILGLLIPDGGSIYIADRRVRPKDRWIYRYIAAVLEGNRNVYWRLTVRENLEFFAGIQGIDPQRARKRADYLMEKFHLIKRENDQVRLLSRGFQQRVAVAVAFIRETPVLFLDEPTLGLDVESSLNLRKTLKELVTQENKTVLLSSHDMKVVEEVCERVIILKNGKIIANDSISNLKDLFKTIAYRVEYENSLSPDLQNQLKGRFLNVIFNRRSFIVEFREPNELYDLMDLLKVHDVVIKSLKSMEPDFERVYIELVKGGS